MNQSNTLQANSRAMLNAERAVAYERILPLNVFSKKWPTILFSDADWIFEVNFPRIVTGLLEIEGGEIACLRNLEVARSQPDESPHFLFSKRETLGGLAYLKSVDRGDQMWISRMADFVCISDVGDWCIYCDQMAEIAITVLADSATAPSLLKFIKPIGGLPIEEALQALELTPREALLPRGMFPHWRDTLLREYGKGRFGESV